MLNPADLFDFDPAAHAEAERAALEAASADDARRLRGDKSGPWARASALLLAGGRTWPWMIRPRYGPDPRIPDPPPPMPPAELEEAVASLGETARTVDAATLRLEVLALAHAHHPDNTQADLAGWKAAQYKAQEVLT